MLQVVGERHPVLARLLGGEDVVCLIRVLLDVFEHLFHGVSGGVVANLYARLRFGLLLARGKVAWGATAAVLTSENLQQARHMCEAFDDGAAACIPDNLPSRAA